MAVSREDQNTFLLIGGIIIVCLVALIAILNSIWQLIDEPINTTIAEVSYFIKRYQPLDYNFPIPATTDQTNTGGSSAEDNTTDGEPSEENTYDTQTEEEYLAESGARKYSLEKNLDYNFYVPVEAEFIPDNESIDRDLKSYPEAIKDIDELGDQQPELNIEIPRISVDSKIFQGPDSNALLEQGFWASPNSAELGEGEVILFCQRRFFGPYDPRSCWFLDKLVINDELTIKFETNSLRYRVVGTNTFEANDPLIATVAADKDLIKIITTSPLYSNNQRLVVLAERVE